MKSGNSGTSREIERKFLLKKLPKNLARYPHGKIAQGYLAVGRGGIQVRLRKKGSVHSLTFKRNLGKAREEREIRLSAAQFHALWPATAGHRLTKVRYDVPWRKYVIEIDVYDGRHEGLVVAEVEFTDEESCDRFVPPSWFGADVSGKSKYSNVALALD